ncbi:hypothetical protein K2173_024927 [Erythroxylum novogranatense]|uniref:Uncharacterized protein n=1 Tax=Erythroxylum novogranatense TaxID=1862640 RepID=A0AAV8UG66_9ROSI|nr:hypothetical protein K2173_024927 [Erythroxylum novogranatense]
MGKKGKWFSNIKKALSPDTKEKKDKKSNQPKDKSFPELQQLDSNSASLGTVTVPSPPSQSEEVRLIESTSEEHKDPYSAPIATPVAAEPAFTPVQPTVEVVQVAKVNRFAGKLSEQAAAIMIQTTFRGYLVGYAVP